MPRESSRDTRYIAAPHKIPPRTAAAWPALPEGRTDTIQFHVRRAVAPHRKAQANGRKKTLLKERRTFVTRQRHKHWEIARNA